jgi:hypothetical protein
MQLRVDIRAWANPCLIIFLGFDMLLFLLIIVVLLHVHLHLQQLVIVEAVSLLPFLDLIQVLLDRASNLASGTDLIRPRARKVRGCRFLRGALAILVFSINSWHFG